MLKLVFDDSTAEAVVVVGGPKELAVVVYILGCRSRLCPDGIFRLSLEYCCCAPGISVVENLWTNCCNPEVTTTAVTTWRWMGHSGLYTRWIRKTLGSRV